MPSDTLGAVLGTVYLSLLTCALGSDLLTSVVLLWMGKVARARWALLLTTDPG